jgi:hypothetical protein
MKQLSELRIAHLLRGGKTFKVATERERQKVLVGAKYQGVKVTTRKVDGAEGWNVLFQP